MALRTLNSVRQFPIVGVRGPSPAPNRTFGFSRPAAQPVATTRPTGPAATGQPGAIRWLPLAQTYSQRSGVPPEIFLALIQAESGGNPNVIGDSGHSVGLFQLNSAGGSGTGLSVAQREDPVTQFNVMVGQIKTAYQNAIAKGLSGRDLAMSVGAQAERPAPSGIPRYGTAYDQIISFLKGTPTPITAPTEAGPGILPTFAPTLNAPSSLLSQGHTSATTTTPAPVTQPVGQAGSGGGLTGGRPMGGPEGMTPGPTTTTAAPAPAASSGLPTLLDFIGGQPALDAIKNWLERFGLEAVGAVLVLLGIVLLYQARK